MPKMKNGGITMTVPNGRVHEFKSNGWIIVEDIETDIYAAEKTENPRHGKTAKDEDKI